MILKKILFVVFFILLLLLVLFSLEVYKGHSLPRLRGVMSPVVFNKEDFKTLDEWNVNVIRWQITSTDELFKKRITNLVFYNNWIDQKLNELDKVLDVCKKYKIKCVIDLHETPGGRYSNNDIRMYYSKKYNDCFIDVWKKIAKRYKDNSAVWAYDLANEPVQSKQPRENFDFLTTQIHAAQEIRKIDKETAIVIAAKKWDNPEGFIGFKPIEDISNLIYQVHMYMPHDYTHQFTEEVITYPGRYKEYDFNKDTLQKALKPVRYFQLTYNVHIFVGEFNAVRWAPGAAQYIDDCIEIFEEYGWDWTYHSFRGWHGWSVEDEDLPRDKYIHNHSVADTERKKVLLKWFRLNKR